MEQEYAKKIHRRVTIAAFGLLALVIVFLVYCGMTEAPQIWFHAAVALFLIVFWTLTVVVEPRLLKALDDRTQEQKSAYYKYAVLEAVGYVGLAWFVFHMGEEDSTGIYGGAVFLLTMFGKRKFWDVYTGKADGRTEEKDEKDEEKPEE